MEESPQEQMLPRQRVVWRVVSSGRERYAMLVVIPEERLRANQALPHLPQPEGCTG